MHLSTIRRNKFPTGIRARGSGAKLLIPIRSWFRMACCVPVALSAGCAVSKSHTAADPAAQMIAQMDGMPPDKRPPSWELTKARMARRPPAFGELAPDFTLPLLDGDTVTRSQCHKDKPLVLIFGSFT